MEFHQSDFGKPPRLINAEEEKIDVQKRFQEEANTAIDIENTTGILLRIGDDFADSSGPRGTSISTGQTGSNPGLDGGRADD